MMMADKTALLASTCLVIRLALGITPVSSFSDDACQWRIVMLVEVVILWLGWLVFQ
jgi:hypothetical protein